MDVSRFSVSRQQQKTNAACGIEIFSLKKKRKEKCFQVKRRRPMGGPEEAPVCSRGKTETENLIIISFQKCRDKLPQKKLSLSLRGVTRRFRPSALPRNIKRLFCCQRNASSDPRSSKILLVCPPVHQVALRRVAKFHRK